MKLVLFDIDGTLLSAGGAGRRAIERALVEIFGAKNVEVFLELGDHDREEVAVLVVAEDAAEFFEAFLLVLALDDRAFVDADADGDLFRFTRLDDVGDLRAVVDVARVEADLVDARQRRRWPPL